MEITDHRGNKGSGGGGVDAKRTNDATAGCLGDPRLKGWAGPCRLEPALTGAVNCVEWLRRGCWNMMMLVVFFGSTK